MNETIQAGQPDVTSPITDKLRQTTQMHINKDAIRFAGSLAQIKELGDYKTLSGQVKRNFILEFGRGYGIDVQGVDMAIGIAREAHESWRLKKLFSGESSVKTTVLGTEVDIVRLSFDELPLEWQLENVVDYITGYKTLVYTLQGASDQDLDKILSDIEFMKEELRGVHEAWRLRRNAWASVTNMEKSANQFDVPFEELDRSRIDSDLLYRSAAIRSFKQKIEALDRNIVESFEKEFSNDLEKLKSSLLRYYPVSNDADDNERKANPILQLFQSSWTQLWAQGEWAKCEIKLKESEEIFVDIKRIFESDEFKKYFRVDVSSVDGEWTFKIRRKTYNSTEKPQSLITVERPDMTEEQLDKLADEVILKLSGRYEKPVDYKPEMLMSVIGGTAKGVNTDLKIVEIVSDLISGGYSNILSITGGTWAGIIKSAGIASDVFKNKFDVVGVTPVGGAIAYGQKIDPNHAVVVEVEDTTDFGNETELMFRLFLKLKQKLQISQSCALLSNGGLITMDEVFKNIEVGNKIGILKDTGRAARLFEELYSTEVGSHFITEDVEFVNKLLPKKLLPYLISNGLISEQEIDNGEKARIKLHMSQELYDFLHTHFFIVVQGDDIANIVKKN